ncbi:mitotic checkpoint regulator, MAD2B-interacting-domain-containing protein [Myxozyma melibiosi]|uniref:Mitotic checkpoint regulator, MAD2B-interacting-domain-containing protein n=1 Tax=Myxozyma melibiosi TaxID=54550 RepID=A0ABR1FAM1_9ASCO
MSETKDSESNSETDRKMEAASTASTSPTTTGTKRSASEVDSSKPAPSETQPRKKKITSKISGFSLGLVAAEPEKPTTTGIPPLPAQPTGVYKPLLLSSLPPLPTIDYKDSQPTAPAKASPPPQQDTTDTTPKTTAPQGIDSLVKEAGMTEQGLQILQGRHRNRNAPIKIVDYNVDEQYSYNQNLRDSGALQTVQPVKGISSGKHQLRTLISSANLQKESLEEAFASGRRNKKESGAKYGF